MENDLVIEKQGDKIFYYKKTTQYNQVLLISQ